MDIVKFKTRIVRIHVRKVHGVAMTEPGAVKERAVGLEGSCAKDNLVLAIAIEVAHGKVMVAFAVESLARLVGRMFPAFLEVLAVKIVSDKVGHRVVAAVHDDTRMHAVKVGDGRKHAFAAVAVGIAPGIRNIALGPIVDGGHLLARISLEHRQVLVAAHNAACRGPVVLAPVANDFALAVDRAVGSLHHNFGNPVTVEVVDHELRVVCAGADVLAEVDSPEARAVQLHAVYKDRARIAVLRVVLRVTRVPLEDQIQLAVAVEVAHAHVVRGVGAGGAVGHRLGFRNIKL